jgi:hypothetical protein
MCDRLRTTQSGLARRKVLATVPVNTRRTISVRETLACCAQAIYTAIDQMHSVAALLVHER